MDHVIVVVPRTQAAKFKAEVVNEYRIEKKDLQDDVSLNRLINGEGLPRLHAGGLPGDCCLGMMNGCLSYLTC